MVLITIKAMKFAHFGQVERGFGNALIWNNAPSEYWSAVEALGWL